VIYYYILSSRKRFKHTCEKSEHHINEYTINEKQTNISKIKLDKKKRKTNLIKVFSVKDKKGIQVSTKNKSIAKTLRAESDGRMTLWTR